MKFSKWLKLREDAVASAGSTVSGGESVSSSTGNTATPPSDSTQDGTQGGTTKDNIAKVPMRLSGCGCGFCYPYCSCNKKRKKKKRKKNK